MQEEGEVHQGGPGSVEYRSGEAHSGTGVGFGAG